MSECVLKTLACRGLRVGVCVSALLSGKLIGKIEWGVFGKGVFQITDLSSNPTSQ